MPLISTVVASTPIFACVLFVVYKYIILCIYFHRKRQFQVVKNGSLVYCPLTLRCMTPIYYGSIDCVGNIEPLHCRMTASPSLRDGRRERLLYAISKPPLAVPLSIRCETNIVIIEPGYQSDVTHARTNTNAIMNACICRVGVFFSSFSGIRALPATPARCNNFYIEIYDL